MRSRFQIFADSFARGTNASNAALYENLLRVVVEDSDNNELREGVAIDEVVRRVTAYESAITHADVVAALQDLPQLHAPHHVRPLILTYDDPQRKLCLGDARFLSEVRAEPNHLALGQKLVAVGVSPDVGICTHNYPARNFRAVGFGSSTHCQGRAKEWIRSFRANSFSAVVGAEVDAPGSPTARTICSSSSSAACHAPNGS
jgi:hypothetical protein